MIATNVVSALLDSDLHPPSLLANLKHRYYAKFGQQVIDKHQNQVVDLTDPAKIAEWREIERRFAAADDEGKKVLWTKYVAGLMV